MRKLGLIFAATVVTLGMTAAASAVPITLTLSQVVGDTVGPQSTSNPCIICATNAQQPAGFGYNNFTSNGGTSSYNMYSTTPTGNVADGVQGSPYTVGQLQGPTGVESGPFDVAIDVNTASGGETLELFEVIDLDKPAGSQVLYNYVGPHLIGNAAQNGNGFADWTLGHIDLAGLGLPATDHILFHAVWDNASDGGESFFLVKAPEPLTLSLFGAGLVGAVAMRRRKAKA